MAKKTKDDVICVEFLGGSRDSVCGSCTKIEYYCEDAKNRQQLICDFGLIQGVSDLEVEYKTNKNMIERVEFEKATHVFFSHQHLDHFMNVPLASRSGFEGRIIMTEPMKEIGTDLLLDGVFIHNRNVDYLRNKKKKDINPFFNESDVHISMHKYVDIYCLDKIYKLNSNLSFRLLQNSHIVSSVIIELFIKKISGKVEKIIYTGDLGSKYNKKYQPFLQDTATISKASMLILESTYGEKARCFTKKDAAEEREDMIRTIKRITKNRGRVILPSFSLGRSQNLMHMLYQAFKDDEAWNIPVIVDSRLTNKINNTYLKVLDQKDKDYWSEVMVWKNFKFIKEYKETEIFALKKDFPCIVISSSGFVQNGHILTWVKSAIERKSDMIMFCGYTGADGSIGNRISDDKYNQVELEGLSYRKNCKIRRYKSFSSHIQQDELVGIVKGLNNSCRVLLHHGSKDAKNELKNVMTEELYKINKTNKIEIVNEDNYKFTL